MNAAEQVAAARAEIARRREVASAPPQGGWWADKHFTGDGYVVMADGLRRAHCPADVDGHGSVSFAMAKHIAANDPTHVLGVLADADATLDRHALDWTGVDCEACRKYAGWPCPDAITVIRRYVPQDPT